MFYNNNNSEGAGMINANKKIVIDWHVLSTFLKSNNAKHILHSFSSCTPPPHIFSTSPEAQLLQATAPRLENCAPRAQVRNAQLTLLNGSSAGRHKLAALQKQENGDGNVEGHQQNRWNFAHQLLLHYGLLAIPFSWIFFA